MVAAISDTFDYLAQARLAVAAKSVLLASNHRLAKAISVALRRRGRKLQPVQQAPYLGIDLSAGKRRGQAAQRQRV
eukprot:916925-Pyramimonas_sp.AAC.1